MNEATIKTLNTARICLANGNIDRLAKIVKGLPPEILCGTVFDRKYVPINLDTIPLIIHASRKREGIKTITKVDKNVLSHKDKGFYLKAKGLENIFISLTKNLDLFNIKFDKKIHKIETNDERSFLVNVNVCNFFHLMGFNLREWQECYKEEILRIFPEFKKILDLDRSEVYSKEERILYDALYTILYKKDILIDEITSGNEVLIKALDMHKVKIKNFIFEKSDFTASPSGIIRLAIQGSQIGGDLFVLRDFINEDTQDWCYLSFLKYRSAPYRRSESLLLNYFPKEKLNTQNIAYTTSVSVLNKDEFLKDGDDTKISSQITFSEFEIEYAKSKLDGTNKVLKKKKIY